MATPGIYFPRMQFLLYTLEYGLPIAITFALHVALYIRMKGKLYRIIASVSFILIGLLPHGSPSILAEFIRRRTQSAFMFRLFLFLGMCAFFLFSLLHIIFIALWAARVCVCPITPLLTTSPALPRPPVFPHGGLRDPLHWHYDSVLVQCVWRVDIQQFQVESSVYNDLTANPCPPPPPPPSSPSLPPLVVFRVNFVLRLARPRLILGLPVPLPDESDPVVGRVPRHHLLFHRLQLHPPEPLHLVDLAQSASACAHLPCQPQRVGSDGEEQMALPSPPVSKHVITRHFAFSSPSSLPLPPLSRSVPLRLLPSPSRACPGNSFLFSHFVCEHLPDHRPKPIEKHNRRRRMSAPDTCNTPLIVRTASVPLRTLPSCCCCCRPRANAY